MSSLLWHWDLPRPCEAMWEEEMQRYFLIFVLLSSLWVSFPDCYKVEQPKAHSQVGTVSLGPEEQTGGHKVIRRLQPHNFSVTIFTAIRSKSTAALSEYPQHDCSSSGWLSLYWLCRNIICLIWFTGSKQAVSWLCTEFTACTIILQGKMKSI